MYIDAAKLEDEVAKHLIRFDYDLVDFQVRYSAQSVTYRVFIDRIDLTPVTVGDCERIALPLRLFLAAMGVYNDHAQLEVSSPGLDRVLKRDKDFERFKGHKVKVRFRTDGVKKTITGILDDFNGSALMLKIIEGPNVASENVSRDDLIEARLVSEV